MLPDVPEAKGPSLCLTAKATRRCHWQDSACVAQHQAFEFVRFRRRFRTLGDRLLKLELLAVAFGGLELKSLLFSPLENSESWPFFKRALPGTGGTCASPLSATSALFVFHDLAPGSGLAGTPACLIFVVPASLPVVSLADGAHLGNFSSSGSGAEGGRLGRSASFCISFDTPGFASCTEKLLRTVSS